MKTILIVTTLALASCAGMPVAMSIANQAIVDGQLFCAARSTVVVIADVSGAPVLAKNASSKFVNDVCALIDGVPVSPPASGVAPTATVNLVKLH